MFTTSTRPSMVFAKPLAPITPNLDVMLKDLGFTTSPSEHAIYTHGMESSRVLLGVYVDDLIVTGTDREQLGWFK
jgi:hypothetical protein